MTFATCAVAEPVQPFASVAVTEYVPESQTVGLWAEDVNPPGPVQLYVSPDGLADI